MNKSLIKIFFIFLVVTLAVSCLRSDKNSKSGAPGKQDTADEINWQQPPVGCPEELVPTVAPKPCPDYSNVENVFSDWPLGYSAEDIAYWQNRKRGIDYCRAAEVLKREGESPGRYSRGQVQVAWMRSRAVRESADKISEVYNSSLKYSVPTTVLVGAIQQESLFSNLFLSEDGGNFSCGVGQANIIEWCDWVSTLSDYEKLQMNWPVSGVNCRLLKSNLVKPFFEKGKEKLIHRYLYQMTYDDVSDVRLEDTLPYWGEYDEQTRQLYFRLSHSFLNHCTDSKMGVQVKAFQLRQLYDRFVPIGFKQSDTYSVGEKFERVCQSEGFAEQYPLHKGWLLAVGMYNAGPRALDNFAHYNSFTSTDLADANAISKLTPKDLVEAFYWSGEYRASTDKIHFAGLRGQSLSWTWFKACVLQRHIARVTQHVTLPGASLGVDTLEGSFGCRMSRFDPATGELIESGVPLFRQTSSGKK